MEGYVIVVATFGERAEVLASLFSSAGTGEFSIDGIPWAHGHDIAQH